jgi:broad specificity phosphatase PhoE
VSLRRLVLLRHGETDFNVEARMQGHLDSHLTEAGLIQIKRAAPLLARLSPDRLLSSDLRRATVTADEIAATTGLPVKIDPRLRETNLGSWEGRTSDEIEHDRPGAIAQWRSDPTWAPPGGGESRVDVVERAMPVVTELDEELAEVSANGDRMTGLLCAHGGLIAGLTAALLELPVPNWASIGGLGNCRWAVLSRRRTSPRWRLAGYNVGVTE